jgi:hypothetical protein
MLGGGVRLVEQWRQIEAKLPEGWGDARLVLTASDDRAAERAAALLGPINPARRGTQVRLYAAREGDGPRPSLVTRLLARLDSRQVEGTLELVSTGKAPAPPPAEEPPTLAAAWDALVEALPSDWSDLYAELELTSTDHLERAALLLAPTNPARFGVKPALRFRCARRFGYGVSPEMARRCLARLDEERIRAGVRVLHALCDTRAVATQGPVWYIGGKAT